MQPIERYGLISLLFAIVTIAVVLSWDFAGAEKPTREVQAANKPQPGKKRGSQRADKFSRRFDPEEAKVLLKTRPRALRRDEPTQTLAGNQLGEPGYRDPKSLDPGLPSAEVVDRREDSSSRLDPSSGIATNTPSAGEHPTAGASTRPEGTAATRPPRAVEKPKPHLYVVQTGDTLSEISLSELGTSKRWQEIVDLNPGLNPSGLRVGARLVLPVTGTGSGTATMAKGSRSSESEQGSDRGSDPVQAKPEPSPSNLPRYAIQSGDSLWTIANRTLGDGERWREIAELNPKLDPDRLFVGQMLSLPAGARVGETVASAQPSTGASTRSRKAVR